MREKKHNPERCYDILMIAPTSFFASYGCHVRILEEARILQELGNKVTIVTYENGEDLDDLHIERTWPIPGRRNYEVGSSRHKIAFDALLALKCATMTGKRPDIIHAHLHEGVFAAYPMSLLWNVPLVFDFQGSMTSEMADHHFLNPKGWLFKPFLRLEQLLNRLPQAIITSSNHAASLLKDQFGCAPERITPVLDCVNAETFTPDWRMDPRVAKLKADWRIPENACVIAYLGLLAEYQGTGLLLQAAAQVIAERPNTHFLIMGFPAVEHYRLQAQALGIIENVTFTGRVRYEQAPLHLAMGDIAVAPKLSATEGSGKLLNYMAMAMPIVAFDTTVSREYLQDDGCYAQVSPSEQSLVDALARQIIKLIDNPEWGRQLGRRLQSRVQSSYSWHQAGQQILSIYRDVLDT